MLNKEFAYARWWKSYSKSTYLPQSSPTDMPFLKSMVLNSIVHAWNTVLQSFSFFFSIFFYYAFMFSRFRLALFLTWSILIAMETGRTVTATWYTWLVSKKNHPNLLLLIRNNLLKAWSFWSPRMLKESIYTLHSTWILTSRRFPIAGDFKHQYFYREIKGKDFMLNKTHNQERISQWSVFFSKL